MYYSLKTAKICLKNYLEIYFLLLKITKYMINYYREKSKEAYSLLVSPRIRASNLPLFFGTQNTTNDMFLFLRCSLHIYMTQHQSLSWVFRLTADHKSSKVVKLM